MNKKKYFEKKKHKAYNFKKRIIIEKYKYKKRLFGELNHTKIFCPLRASLRLRVKQLNLKFRILIQFFIKFFQFYIVQQQQKFRQFDEVIGIIVPLWDSAKLKPVWGTFENPIRMTQLQNKGDISITRTFGPRRKSFNVPRRETVGSDKQELELFFAQVLELKFSHTISFSH